MPDDRPVSPEERVVAILREYGVSVRYRANLAEAIVAALSTPAGPSPEPVRSTDYAETRANRTAAPSPREEAVEAAAKAANDMRWAARKLRDGGEPPIVANMLGSYAAALSAARPSSPTPEETREVEALREAAHAAHEFAGNVIRYATGPVKPELWEDDSPLVEQAWSIVRATDPGAATTKEGR